MADQPAPQPSQLTGAFKKPFAEQVAFFRQKLGNLVPTARWDDLWKAEHDRAFMVAGAAKADLLADLAAAVDQAIIGKSTLEHFREDFRAIVAARGWHGWTGEGSKGGEAWRTRIIYTTNSQTSYSAGRMAQLRDGGFALWVYRHNDSVLHPRPQHLAWNGLTLPPSHPFWQTHYPPNGWGCKCYVLGARDDQGAARLGGHPAKQPPAGWDATDPKTGEQPGIDRGWGYMPGATVSDTVRALAPKLETLPAPLADGLSRDIRRRTALTDAEQWVIEEGQKNAQDKIEFAAVINSDGGMVLRKKGVASAVQFDDDEIARMFGGTLIHNHPSSGSLSLADLHLAAHARCEMIAVGHDGTRYTAMVDQMISAHIYHAADQSVYDTLWPRIHAGKISTDAAGRWHHHILNAALAGRGMITYRMDGDAPGWTVDAIDEVMRRLHDLHPD